MIGKTIAHYRILEPLGQGGMGEVYLAEDTKLDRRVALKFLPPALWNEAEAQQRLIREARAAARVNHPNVVAVHEVDIADGEVFIAMELVEGESLAARLEKGPLPLDKVHPLHEVVKVDYFIPGCPPPAEEIWAILSALLTGKPIELPYEYVKKD